MTASVRAPQRWHKISAMAGIGSPRAEVLHTRSRTAHASPRVRGQARGSRTFREIRADSVSSEAPIDVARSGPASATCSPTCPSGSASVSAGPTGRHSMTPSANATEAATPDPRRRARQRRLHRRGEMPGRRPRRARRPPALPDDAPPQVAIDQPARAVARRGQTPHQGDRPLPRRDQLPHARVGRARPLHHPRQERRQVQPARTPTPAPHQIPRQSTNDPRGGERRLD